MKLLRVPLGVLLDRCEQSGGAVDPLHVMALVAAARRQAGAIAELAKVILDSEIACDHDRLADLMIAARTVELPVNDDAFAALVTNKPRA